MLVRIDFSQITFAEPVFLWLLVIPALLFALWIWRLIRRRMDIRSLARHRTLPVRERYAAVGDLPFWLCLIASTVFLILALARPHGPATAVRQGGIDMVHAAGRLGVDARQGRGRRSLAALGPLSPHARRRSQLE